MVYMIYVENPKVSMQNILLELIKKFSKVSGYNGQHKKINYISIY